MIDQIFHRCDGVIGIVCDINVHGKNDVEHDQHLHNLCKLPMAMAGFSTLRKVF